MERQFAQQHVAVIWDFAQVDVSSAFRQAPEATQGGECEGWGNPMWLYPNITSPTTTPELQSALCNFFTNSSEVGAAAPPPISAMEAVEEMLAGRYASDPTVVGLDMFNEPWFGSTCGTKSVEGQLLTDFFTHMGRSIIGANPHLLLIFEDSPSTLMANTPIIGGAPSLPNVVYEFHTYTSNWSTAQPYVQTYLRNAQTWGVPLWMGEFDSFNAGCTGTTCPVDPNWQADTQTMLSFCGENGISWSFFSYYSLATDVHTAVAKSLLIAVLRAEL